MGVLGCDRKGCENIMCDRYSNEYGYICHECFEELVDYGVEVDVEEFMSLEKTDDDNTEEMRAREYFGDIFQKRDKI